MSRNDGRSTRLRRRPSRTIPALVAGILLLAISVGLVWVSIARLIDGTWSTLLAGPRDWLVSQSWNGASVWAIGIVAVVVGLILLLCALIPGSFNALTVRSGAAGQEAEGKKSVTGVHERETVMTKGAVAHVARAQCAMIDGVSSASATAGSKHVHLKVHTYLRETSDLHARVIREVQKRLNTIGLDPVPRITATIDTQE
ncbi:MAG: DUF6286 domain-containing protein [Specibacter sp.]